MANVIPIYSSGPEASIYQVKNIAEKNKPSLKFLILGVFNLFYPARHKINDPETGLVLKGEVTQNETLQKKLVLGCLHI